MPIAAGSAEAGLSAVLLVWVIGGVIAYAVWRGRKAPMIQAVPREARRDALITGAVVFVVLVVAMVLVLVLA